MRTKNVVHSQGISGVNQNSEGQGDGLEGVETLFQRITTPIKVQKLQRALYCKAKAEPKYRFYSLYGELLRKDVLETAMASVAHNNGAAGIDGQTCDVYLASDEAWDQWRNQLLEELRTKKYRPSPVKRVYIPKGDGKLRPLGIPTVKDRVVQTAVVIVLLPIDQGGSAHGEDDGQGHTHQTAHLHIALVAIARTEIATRRARCREKANNVGQDLIFSG